MQRMIENLINGNITDAKKAAARHYGTAIIAHLREMGWSRKRAVNTANYLKGMIAWQTYCDTEAKCIEEERR